MRFRATYLREYLLTTLSSLLMLIVCFAQAARLQSREYRAALIAVLLFQILSVSYGFLGRYWEMDEIGLRQRMVPWINARIQWQDVTRIESSWAAGHSLKIEYKLPSGRLGRIWPIGVADHEPFLAELHRLAPHAEFAEKSNGNVLSIIS